jgi:hypothetical protein
MKFQQVVAGLFLASGTVDQSFFTTALPDLAGLAIRNQCFPLCKASVTVDIFRLQIEPIRFNKKRSRLSLAASSSFWAARKVGQIEQTRPQ